jgi:hypothetical protein
MRRTLLRFNLAAAVPSDAIIDLARLDLYLEGSQGPDSINLVAARLTEDWIESQVTWNNRPATGDPVEATLVDTTVSPVRVDVTDIVRAWHNVPHYGLELRGPEGETVYNLIFGSREHGEMLPQLAVTYHLPSPTYTFTGNVYQGSPRLIPIRLPVASPLNSGRMRMNGPRQDLRGFGCSPLPPMTQALSH